MHELPVVEDVIRVVGEQAKERGFHKVTRITLVIGELASVMDESVQMYFELLAEGTPCEGALLVFEHTSALFRCSACGLEFPHEREFVCPRCGADAVLVKGTGRDLYIRSIEGAG